MTDQEKIDDVVQFLMSDEYNVEIVISKLMEDEDWKAALWEITTKASQATRMQVFGDYTRDLARKYLKSIAKDLALDDRDVV